ncbi:hypothetical protein DdX_18722 [Ditylenchus destructor]|uniref:Uncharacterized protein n=1 Tax=Ditylenchus destructor TaxID=166010 RepID=A0AAD4QUN1_9BILA|nr:hypothetical protein DdX_18722 [Ditylenchus destructor]
MKQKVVNHQELEEKFGTPVTDGSKIIETLNSSLKLLESCLNLEQPRIEKEENTPKGYIKKLPEFITTLGAIKKGAKSNDLLDSYADDALECAGELSKALDAALKVEEKTMNIVDLKKSTRTDFYDSQYRSLRRTCKKSKRSKRIAKICLSLY